MSEPDAEAPAHGRWSLVLGLVALGLLVIGSVWAASRGHLSIDEGVYHLMVRDTAAGVPFDLGTGYGTFASPELLYVVPDRTAHTQLFDGRVISQYPFLFPALAAPLYRWLGPYSMVAINLLASALGIGLCAWIAVRITGRRRAGVVAALLLAFAGFWLDYAYALWPHVTGTTAWLAGVACLWPSEADDDVDRGRAFVGGLCLGAAWCIRLDAAVLAVGTVAVLALPPGRRVAAVGSAIGLALPVAALSATHLIKFGSLNPLSYGVDVDPRTGGASGYGGLVMLGIAVFVALALLRGPADADVASTRKRRLVAAAIVAVVCVWQTPMILALLRGGRALVFDLAMVSDAAAETGRLRTGALVYGGAIKKALVQSCPHAIAVLALTAARWRSLRPGPRRGIAMLLLPVLGLTAVFALRSWHGGASINMRYFVPWLPVLAVLGAMACDRLLEDATASPSVPALVAAVTLVAGAIWAGVALLGLDPEAQEPWIRGIPMLTSVAALLGALLWVRRPSQRTARGLTVTFALAVAWSTTMGFSDLAWTVRTRTRHAALEEIVDARVEPGALVIAQVTAPLYGLLERGDVLVASAQSDHGQDLARLARLGLADGRPVYFFFVAGPSAQHELGSRMPELRFEVIPVAAGLALYRPIGLAPASGAR